MTRGLTKGWSGFLWICKILLPVSFFTFLLDASGILAGLDFLFEPAMGLLGLPPQAALPLVIGLLTGIYGGIAAMAVLPLTEAHMTLIAVFLLISHALIQEGIVQGKSGFGPVRATLWRLGAAIITVTALAPFLDHEVVPGAFTGIATGENRLFSALFFAWCGSTGLLVVKMFLIIMPLMVLLETMKAYRLTDRLVQVLSPVLKLMGLNQQVGVLWLTAILFGVSYGAAVIIEESREERLDPKDLERLHVSIGINHSIIEDPILFMSFGLNAFYLWIPRLAAAMIAVHLFKLYARFAPGRRSDLSVGKKLDVLS